MTFQRHLVRTSTHCYMRFDLAMAHYAAGDAEGFHNALGHRRKCIAEQVVEHLPEADAVPADR